MVLGFAAIGSLIKRVRARRPSSRSRATCSRFVVLEMVGDARLRADRLDLAARSPRSSASSSPATSPGRCATTWLNEQITDSSVRATVLSITGQSNAIGQAAGGPVLGAGRQRLGHPRRARRRRRSRSRPRSALYARAIAHDGARAGARGAPSGCCRLTAVDRGDGASGARCARGFSRFQERSRAWRRSRASQGDERSGGPQGRAEADRGARASSSCCSGSPTSRGT